MAWTLHSSKEERSTDWGLNSNNSAAEDVQNPSRKTLESEQALAIPIDILADSQTGHQWWSALLGCSGKSDMSTRVATWLCPLEYRASKCATNIKQ